MFQNCVNFISFQIANFKGAILVVVQWSKGVMFSQTIMYAHIKGFSRPERGSIQADHRKLAFL